MTLLLLLVVGMTLCNVSHHHAGSSDANCSICHLSHQAIDQPLPAASTRTLAQVGVQFDLQEPGFTPNPLKPRLPARAPPSV
ncbi:MAG TPA: hypothetical protein VGD60_12425 [Candidatus Acidoferrales bacterium]